MKRVHALFLTALLALSVPAHAATVREIDATELRKIVSAGQTISMKRVIDSVAKATGGQPVEARAFEADGIVYRIVLKNADGTLVSIIIDARTGKQITKNSAMGRQITAAAANSGGKSKGQSNKNNAGNNGGGNSNNGGGNSGGGNSGGGNSGGGGGNSGGGGGGNGGGGKK